jgi:carboxypeptidase T
MKKRSYIGLGLLSGLLLASCSGVQSLPQGFVPGGAPANVNSFSAPAGLPKQVVEIRWQNRNQIVNLAAAGVDLFGAKPAQRTAKARVSTQELEVLKAQGVQVLQTREPSMDTRGGLPGGYMTYAQMTEKLKEYAAKYPNLVTLEDVGDTWLKTQGKAPQNDIWSISVTNKQNRAQKPSLMLTSGVHSRELAPVELTMKLVDELLTKYGSDPQITELVNTRELIVLPMVNVDGRVMVEQGNSWQRKNANGPGIDINRNFDSHWNYEGLNVPNSWKNGLTNPNTETYSGPRAASEPETQAVQGMYTRKKITASVDIHAYGDMFFWPLGYSENPIPEVALYKNVYNATFGKIGYSGGTSLSLLYPTTGTTDDYGYVKHHAFSMGMEVGSSFRPSYSDVERMWVQHRPLWLTMLNMIGTMAVR